MMHGSFVLNAKRSGHWLKLGVLTVCVNTRPDPFLRLNGRVYDYELGRFLSVDPVIQFPTSTQSMNPYSYIMNNPLSGRDPTGYTYNSDRDPRSIGHGLQIIGVAEVTGPFENGADEGSGPKGSASVPTSGRSSDIGAKPLDIGKGVQIAYATKDPKNYDMIDAGLDRVRDVAKNSRDLTDGERVRIENAANAYGFRGEPGVEVDFNDNLTGGTGAVTKRNSDGTETVTFPSSGTIPLPRTAKSLNSQSIVHEGQHLIDGKALGRGLGTPEERLDTEINAYTVQAMYQKGAFEPSSLKNDPMWLPSIGYNYDNIFKHAKKSVDTACSTASASNDPSC
ncbi:MAG TPA: RHS repeat-associated core domain-containing protein [Dokdonella sp.]|uniref:RHS repeat-associated core domain-containing protein n=1 Tax=Dokdonella sp. TaxID=2291710 RepID=UPI002D802410|nr:RHS repeat-associated core domain-containing protein [Dokdonella sp.]HET9034065.1 RHS repeat-associated core domain-containing protein [Dokdonella sp.]